MNEKVKSISRTRAPGSAGAVIAHIDRIATLWAAGHTFDGIVAALKLPATGNQLRKVVFDNPDLVIRLDEYHEMRAQSLVEHAAELAYAAAATGEPAGYRIAIDTMMKLSAKLDPGAWGDGKKVEVTGAGGDPVAAKADITLSPSDAYARMVGAA